jgi:hypothetical protein
MEADSNEQPGDRSTEYTYARLVPSPAGGSLLTATTASIGFCGGGVRVTLTAAELVDNGSTDATSEGATGRFSEEDAMTRCRRPKAL